MTIPAIISQVAASHGLTPAQLAGRSRKARLVAARREVCRLAWEQGWTLAVIGRAIGRSHTSVIKSLRK